MNWFLIVLLGLFGVTLIIIAAGVFARPLIGRIAIREAARRPGQTAVLALGLMIAGAGIFSIQVIFDTMYETQRIAILQQWGRDDIEVSGGGAYFDAGNAQRLTTDSASCACIAGVQNAVVGNASVVDLTRQAGRPNVQTIGLDLAAQQRFGSFVLTSGKTTLGDELVSGGVFLTQPLAESLGAQADIRPSAPASLDISRYDLVITDHERVGSAERDQLLSRVAALIARFSRPWQQRRCWPALKASI